MSDFESLPLGSRALMEEMAEALESEYAVYPMPQRVKSLMTKYNTLMGRDTGEER